MYEVPVLYWPYMTFSDPTDLAGLLTVKNDPDLQQGDSETQVSSVKILRWRITRSNLNLIF